VTGAKKYENPEEMDRLLKVLGAEAIPWSYKTDCCGGSLTISKTEIVVRMVDKLMEMAREAGANCLVTACPVCMANLDMRSSGDVGLPVFYFTELAGLAMGQEGPEGWFRLHRTDPRPILKGLQLL
jgi:heterodisulfide reductase subunit B